MSDDPIRILLVEDSLDDARSLSKLLEEADPLGFGLVRAQGGVDALDLLRGGGFEVVLIDLSLGRGEGLRAFEKVSTAAPGVPVVVVAAQQDVALARRALREGAQDYLIKEMVDARRLADAVRYAIERAGTWAAFREASEVLEALIEASPLAIVALDRDGRVRTWNEAAERMFGWTEREALGRPLPFVPGESAEQHRELLESVLRGAAFTGIELHRRRKDGTPIEISASAAPLRDASGAVRGIMAVIADVTERRKLENELRESERRLRLHNRVLVELSRRELVHGGELDAVLREATEAAAHALGVDRVGVWLYDEGRTVLRGVDIYDRHREQHSAGHDFPTARFPIFFKALETERSIAVSDVRADARMHEFVAPYFAPLGIVAVLEAPVRVAGRLVGVVCHEHIGSVRAWAPDEQNFAASIADLVALAIEAADRRRAEQALRESEERFRSLVENSSDIIHIMDPDGRIRYVSPSVEHVLGYRPEELIGRFGQEFTHPDDFTAKADAIAKILKHPHTKGPAIEQRLLHRDGTWRICEVTGQSFIDAEGQPRIVVNSRDITERKRIEEALRESEEQLRRSQRLEAVGRLAGGIAHDFNNLLTAIRGHAEMGLTEIADTRAVQEDLQEIERAAARAAALTRQLLAFSRRQVLQPEVIELNGVVLEMEKMLRRLIGEDVEFVTVLDPGLGKIKVDRGQIEQVIMNLTVNARDAMPNGGRLTIETRNVELDPAYAHRHVAVREGPYVMLAVSDTGCGMDAETQAHIFEPFFTTKEKEKGTGLGLSTVYGIIKQSGGNVWVYSEVGRGTTFKIYLPRVEEDAAIAAEQGVRVAEDVARGTETVLLVEDEAAVRALAHKILVRNGYRVLEAKNGRDALALVARHPGEIHLMVTDLVMPDMGGKDLVDRVIETRPTTRVLYMSGYTERAVLHHGVLEPGVHFIEKPFSPDEFADKVRQVLDMDGAA